MAGPEKKSSLALRAYRRAGRAALETAAGQTIQGRGLVTALRQETGEPGGKRHFLGTLDRPLYRFAGYLPETEGARGGVLTQAGRRYTVLDCRRIFLGERELCVRMLLERRDENESG